jgi:hypothetical protein
MAQPKSAMVRAKVLLNINWEGIRKTLERKNLNRTNENKNIANRNILDYSKKIMNLRKKIRLCGKVMNLQKKKNSVRSSA